MKRSLILAGTACLLARAPLAAAVTDAQFAELQAALGALSQRVQTLEAENTRLQGLVDGQPATAVASKPAPASWTDRVSVSGDFRYRYEAIDLEGRDKRDRNRIRARAEIKAQVTDTVVVGTGLASGGDDPVSANQTLGGGGSRKDLGLNLAYVHWQPGEDLYLTAGKMKNNFFRPQKSSLLWDGDYNPEGLGAGWSNDLLFVTAGANWLESDNNRGNQQLAWGLQGGVNLALGDAVLTAGVGYFDIPVAGNATFFGDADEFYGNSFVCADAETATGCVYRYDYEELEWFADLSLEMFGMPAAVYADLVQNLAVDDFDTGYLVGLRLGKAAERGTWELGYEYEDLEADAAFGLASDSDFAAGGTDGKGHKLYGAYALDKRVQLGFTWFVNNEVGEHALAQPLQYDRLQLDASFKY